MLGGEQGVAANIYGVSWRGDENVLKLILVMVVQLYAYTKNYGTLYFKWVNCMVF